MAVFASGHYKIFRHQTLHSRTRNQTRPKIFPLISEFGSMASSSGKLTLVLLLSSLFLHSTLGNERMPCLMFRFSPVTLGSFLPRSFVAHAVAGIFFCSRDRVRGAAQGPVRVLDRVLGEEMLTGDIREPWRRGRVPVPDVRGRRSEDGRVHRDRPVRARMRGR